MEKKTILAFVLSLAVLIVWSILFAPQPAQKTDSPAKEGTAPSQPLDRLASTGPQRPEDGKACERRQ